MARKQRNAVVNNIGVYYDHQRRTCLLVADGEQVEYIPLDIQDGFQVHTTSMASFDQRYTKMPDYPLDKAAQLYLNYCLAVGATDEVIDHLSRIISVTDEDRKIATSKRAVAEKPARKRRSKSTVTEYILASQMFQGLIMEGKLTDDEIFAQVQEAFDLDAKKRSYVGWYRNKLRKDGQNPPEAK